MHLLIGTVQHISKVPLNLTIPYALGCYNILRNLCHGELSEDICQLAA